MTEETRNIIRQAIEARILQALAKNAVRTEKNLRDEVAAVQDTRGLGAHTGYRHTRTRYIPEAVVTEALKGLNEAQIIKRVRHEGATYVAMAGAANEHIKNAAERVKESPKKRNQTKLCGRISYQQAANEYMPGDSSQEPEACLYEGSVAVDALEAETPYSIDREARDPKPRSKKLTDVAQRRIAYQQARPQMMRNNARKAKQRWIQADGGQEWLTGKRLEKENREEDRTAFANDPAA